MHRTKDKCCTLPGKVRLKRELGFLQATICGVGIILGAGIYALIGLGAGYAGNALWLSFLIAAVISMFSGLSYAELSSMYKSDAAEYEYSFKALGRIVAVITGIIIFGIGIFTAATVSLAFGGYFVRLAGGSTVIFAILLLIVMSLINYSGIKQSTFLNTISTIIEFIGLIIIIILGIKHFGSINYFDMPNGFVGVMQATALIFFAYIGFDSVVKLSEETKRPEKNIPLALLASIVITSLLYVLVAASAVSILSWDKLSISNAPLADAAAASFGVIAFTAIGIIALFSTSNTVLMDLVATSRIAYGMAVEKVFPASLKKINTRTNTPTAAIFLVFITTIIFIMIDNLHFVANIADLLIFVVFFIVNLSAIILRYTQPRVKRPFKIPLNIGRFSTISALGAVSSVLMIYFTYLNLS